MQALENIWKFGFKGARTSVFLFNVRIEKDVSEVRVALILAHIYLDILGCYSCKDWMVV